MKWFRHCYLFIDKKIGISNLRKENRVVNFAPFSILSVKLVNTIKTLDILPRTYIKANINDRHYMGLRIIMIT